MTERKLTYVDIPIFSSKLISGEFRENTRASSIMSLQSNPDMIVKQVGILARDKPNYLKSFSEAKDLFSQLETDFNIAIPDYNVVLGDYYKSDERDRNYPAAAFIITNRITGNQLGTENQSNKALSSFAKATEALYKSLVDYYMHFYRNGGTFLADLENSAFIYGKQHTSEKDRYYLVDLDPRVDKFDANNLFNPKNAWLLIKISELEEMITQAESVHSLNLTNAKEYLEKASNSIDPGVKKFHEDFIQDESL